MANVAKSDVTILAHWTEGSVTGKRHAVLQVQVVLDGAGSGASSKKIPASAFGLREVLEVSTLVEDDNSTVYVAAPSFNGKEILIRGEDKGDVADASGTFKVLIRGILE